MTTQNKISVRITALLKNAGIDTFTSHLSYGEIAKEMAAASSNLDGFAEACYNQNTTSDLTECLKEDADESDMDAWNIDANEWHTSIKKALLAKAFDEIYDDLIDAEK